MIGLITKDSAANKSKITKTTTIEPISSYDQTTGKKIPDISEHGSRILFEIRSRLEDQSVRDSDIIGIFELIEDHLVLGEPEVQYYALRLLGDILPQLSTGIDGCVRPLLPHLFRLLGSRSPSLRSASLDLINLYSRKTRRVKPYLMDLVLYGLESPDARVVQETLACLSLIIPPDCVSALVNDDKNILISGLGKKLSNESTRWGAFLGLRYLSECLCKQDFSDLLGKLDYDERKLYKELIAKTTKDDYMSRPRKNSGIWVEYGAIDSRIISKLKDEENGRVRLRGTEELLSSLSSMKDLGPLLPQIRPFLNFLDSVMEEEGNFKINLLVLEIYGVLIDRMRGKIKPHLRTFVYTLLKKSSYPNLVVRSETFRIIKKLSISMSPNAIINQSFEHLGDRRSIMRESVLDLVIFLLLTFPSSEFNLKTIAATVVPTLVDPKRRVRQASQEAVAVLAAFMGPSKTIPFIRSIELLENHFESGFGVLSAVKARLSRRQLPRITQDGLVEYSLSIPSPTPSRTKSFGADVDWILAGLKYCGKGEFILKEKLEALRIKTITFDEESLPPTPRKASAAIRAAVYKPRSSGSGSLSSIPSKPSSARFDDGRNSASFPNSPVSILGTSIGGSLSAPLSKEPYRSRSEERICSDDLFASKLKENDETVHSPPPALPRLSGTKSQASTASSSATRDSGISLAEHKVNGDEQTVKRLPTEQLPITGKSLPLTDRRHSISSNVSVKERKSSKPKVEPSKKMDITPAVGSATFTQNSSCEYEEDFTSEDDDDRSEVSYITHKSNIAESNPKVERRSRIPLKRNSSLRKKRSVMKNYGVESITNSNFLNVQKLPESPSPRTSRSLSTGHRSPTRQTKEISGLYRYKSLASVSSMNQLQKSPMMEDFENASEPFGQSNKIMRTPPRSPVPQPTPMKRTVGVMKKHVKPAVSTTSLSSNYSLSLVPIVKTQATLKSPLDGNVRARTPVDNPETFLKKCIDQLHSANWETSLDGLLGVYRLVEFHSEILSGNLKEVLLGVMKQVKNLRSQVCRMAVTVVGEMFRCLKRQMDGDLEKIAGPLILKTGDTNKFLREDCNLALDNMIENLTPSKIVIFVTSETFLYHKNPVIRTTVSRLLAYLGERLGPNKILSGSRDITDKFVPAVAKLAQDGSQEARQFARLTLSIMMNHSDFEMVLKRSLNPNSLRNIEKIIDAIKRPKNSAAPTRKSTRGSYHYQDSRRSNSRKTL